MKVLLRLLIFIFCYINCSCRFLKKKQNHVLLQWFSFGMCLIHFNTMFHLRRNQFSIVGTLAWNNWDAITKMKKTIIVKAALHNRRNKIMLLSEFSRFFTHHIDLKFLLCRNTCNTWWLMPYLINPIRKILDEEK